MHSEPQELSTANLSGPLSNLSAAMELVLDELEGIVAEILGTRDEIIALREQLASNKKNKVVKMRRRRNLGRLGPGIKTPKEAFYLPILTVLKEAQGCLPRSRVIHEVDKLTRRMLTEVDYERLHGDGSLRWEVTCNEARQTMVKDGRMKQSNRRFIWEITHKGLEWLKANE